MKPSDYLNKYGSDKANGHSYGDFYDGLFSHSKEPMDILEIGVWKGDSIHAWKEAFPTSRITGIDIKDEFEGSREGVELIFEDVKNVKLTGKYDVIIDDGSHNLREILYVVMNFCKHLKKNGVMVIEDIMIIPDYYEAISAVLPKGFYLDQYDLRSIKGVANDALAVIGRS